MNVICVINNLINKINVRKKFIINIKQKKKKKYMIKFCNIMLK